MGNNKDKVKLEIMCEWMHMVSCFEFRERQHRLSLANEIAVKIYILKKK